eukprot:TRINITY_DN14147_c0_g1_i1.p1 TRINITY_DN14147_c0_g1~~TRINITY_DN14147_c0_g1_i1.p1  ORF type:complete len:216 (-),score=15.99 TRINITY_DN14147_c0_g1_i1:121-768(-)
MPITVGSRRDFSISRRLDETLILDGLAMQSQSQMSRSAGRRFNGPQTFEDGTTIRPQHVFDSIARRSNESLIPRWSDESLVFNALTMPSHFRATRRFLEPRTFEAMPSHMFDSISGLLDESFMLDVVLRESELLHEQMGFRFVPATSTAIDTLKTEKFEEGMKSSTCTICLDDFIVGMHLKCMPCMHLFHKDCIVNWLKQSNSCPICRSKLQDEN